MKVRQTVTHVPIERLTAHPANVRDDLGDLTELARSIVEHGILQPLTATEDPDHEGKLLLLAGHRRLGAACLARLDVVPVIVRHGIEDLDEQLIVMLVENTQRRDLNPIERAEAYDALRNRGLTAAEIARRTGTSQATVSYYLTLLRLPEEEREEVRAGSRAVTQALAAARAERQEERLRLEGRPAGRPKGRKTTPYFSKKHPLAKLVRRLCDHRGRPKVGSVGCGQCWEQVIREDALRAEPSRAEPSRAEPSRAAFDDVVVLRRLAGDRSVRMRKPDRVEIVRRARAAGWSLGDIERIAGVTKPERYIARDGLEEAS